MTSLLLLHWSVEQYCACPDLKLPAAILEVSCMMMDNYYPKATLSLLLLLLPLLGDCWWPFSSSEEEVTPQQEGALEMRKVVQFEMSSAEQRFLAEAQQFLDLPQLDQCQHVVSINHCIVLYQCRTCS